MSTEHQTIESPGGAPRAHKSTYATIPGGNPNPPPGNPIEECGDCGRHSIIEAHDVDLRGQRTYRRKCAHCGSRNIISALMPATIKPEGSKPMGTIKGNHKTCKNHPDKYAVVEDVCYICYKEKYGVPYTPKSRRGKKSSEAGVTQKQDPGVKPTKDRSCKYQGCTKIASIKGVCKNHFECLYGIKANEFKRRKKAGETEETIFASVKGPPEKPYKIDPEKEMQATRITDKVGITENAALDLMVKRAVTRRNDPIDPMTISVDFTTHTDLLAKLTDVAAASFRTPEQQILFLISKADDILQRAGWEA